MKRILAALLVLMVALCACGKENKKTLNDINNANEVADKNDDYVSVQGLNMLTYYSDNDSLPNKEISLDLGEKGSYDIYKVDNEHNGELVAVTDNLSFELELYSMVLIKEK